jgi:hypothetical protein
MMDRTDESAKDTVTGILSKYLARSDAVLGLEMPAEIKEAKSSSILQETLRSVGALVLSNVRPTSALANCVNSGSKGNVMNIAQIGGCVGQQTVYGRRVPLRATRLGPRTLVYYAPGDLRAEARGFISNSYMSGLTPAEFFEHQMAGREGIVATAVNTSESGYNQRRMIKGQESQCVSYDGTVRVSSNIIIETFYGGDDLDGSRLEKVKVPWIFHDLQTLDANSKGAYVESLRVLCRHAAWRANLFKDLDPTFPCAIAIGSILGIPLHKRSVECTMNRNTFLDAFANDLFQIHKRHHSSTRALMNVSIACAIVQAAEFVDILQDRDKYKILLNLYNKSIVAPGEGVGALGASSIGEPSMQMTLNVFHYSGIADKNVTITGLPRFKQLINGVDTYETANMTVELRDYEDLVEGLQISNVKLSDVSGAVTVDMYTGPMETLFEAFHGLRGPIGTKLGLTMDDPKRPSKGLFHVKVPILWTSCARRNIDVATVARALRETLSYDAIVVAAPHWSSSGGQFATRIDIYFAPYVRDRLTVDAILEALGTQQHIRGLDYVKNVIAFQERRWTSDGQPRSRYVLETEGSNVVDLAKCPCVVPETIRTTNVVEACNILGISAGLTVLQAELHKVLSFDSAYIDPRHTWLLADTMGRVGTLAAMNRHNMESLGSSLLQRASFEQSLDVFEEGAAFGRSDPLAGATERIITGQPVSIGTGLIGIVNQDQHTDQEMVLVEPLASISETSDAIVGPLHDEDLKDIEKDSTIDVWSIPLTQLPKETQGPGIQFFISLGTQFRHTAAVRRQCPSMFVRKKLRNSDLNRCLDVLDSTTAWTYKEGPHFVTETRWKHGDPHEYGLTRTSVHFNSESFFVSKFESLEEHKKYAEIFLKKKLTQTEIPL